MSIASEGQSKGHCIYRGRFGHHTQAALLKIRPGALNLVKALGGGAQGSVSRQGVAG